VRVVPLGDHNGPHSSRFLPPSHPRCPHFFHPTCLRVLSFSLVSRWKQGTKTSVIPGVLPNAPFRALRAFFPPFFFFFWGWLGGDPPPPPPPQLNFSYEKIPLYPFPSKGISSIPFGILPVLGLGVFPHQETRRPGHFWTSLHTRCFHVDPGNTRICHLQPFYCSFLFDKSDPPPFLHQICLFSYLLLSSRYSNRFFSTCQLAPEPLFFRQEVHPVPVT